MATETNIPLLATLDYVNYIDDHGQIPEQFQGKIGVYAIFDQDKVLQFVGYSRDVHASLKQHLVRQPQQCYFVKAQTIDRPSRAILENIEQAWIAENGTVPLGNSDRKAEWTNAINAKAMMTAAEQENYQNPVNDELAQMKILKNVARRVEAEILAVLESRGVQTPIRFNPKLKEEGLLDLK